MPLLNFKHKKGMKKLLFILGTRPEAIKLAPLIRELYKHPKHFDLKIGLTGQHPDMADEAFKIFDITPHLILPPFNNTRTLTALNAHVLTASEALIQKAKPDLVIVQGDTASALGGASAAFYEHIPVAHVEAGLRSGSLESPFPEEFNRITISRIAQWHFAPTSAARQNLLSEGVASERILLSGNTGIDALLYALNWLRRNPKTLAQYEEQWKRTVSAHARLIAVTLHRRENLAHLERICRALRQLVEGQPSLHLAFVMHPNPEVRRPVHHILDKHPHATLLPPLSYTEMLALLQYSRLIITDSGGIQEEAPTLGKPVVVVRSHTERQELLEGNAALLCDPSHDDLEKTALKAMDMAVLPTAANPFGDGKAAQRIVSFLLKVV